MSKRLIRPIFCIAFLLIFLTAVGAQPELDLSFNGTGKATVDFTQANDTAYDVIVQPDNKIVAVGTAATDASPRNFALTRFNTNGSLDTTFGAGGRVITDFDANAVNEGALAATVQPDGKIIAAGYVSLISPGPGYFALARYNPDGSLDTTFGNGGMVLTAIVQHINEARAVAVGQDGTIVAAGFYFGPNQNFQTLIARYNTNGTLLGTSTNSQGSVIGDANVPRAVAVQPDGKIVTAGAFSANFSDSGGDIKMLRFNADGSPDTSFGSSGAVLITSPGASEFLNAIAIMPDGRIVAVGVSHTDFLVMRFNADGSRDTTFRGTGRVHTQLNNPVPATSVILRPNGKILASGGAGGTSAIVSFNSDGTLDTSFSGDGKLEFQFAWANGMAIDGLGRIVLGGSSAGMFAAARFYSLDPPVPVTVTGQTVSPGDTPLRNIRVGLICQDGQTRWANTSAFGYFVFDNVLTGQTCTLFVRGSKHYSFEPRSFGVNEAIDDLVLIGTALQHRPGGDAKVKPELKRSNDHYR